MKSDMVRLYTKDKRSVNGVDVMKNLDVGLVSHSKQLRHTDYNEEIDLYEQFKREQAESGEYRVIVTINPFCTNVLFNPLTEIAEYKDGEWSRLIYGDEKLGKIQNTSRSSSDNVLYYCGFDIFDNHLLRSKTFTVVNKEDENKIDGLMYDGRGTNETNKLKTSVRWRWDDVDSDTDKPLYTVDDLYHFYDSEKEVFESFEHNVYEEDGWFGFLNTSSLNSRVFDGSDLKSRTWSNVINNRGNCEFNDLYPDRTLFTFTPVYNRFAKRDEDNWEVFVTYPSEKISNDFTGNDAPSLPVVEALKKQNAFGSDVFVMRSLTRHNLKRNDTIRLLVQTTENQHVSYKDIDGLGDVMVGGVGDENGLDKDYCFVITDPKVISELTESQPADTYPKYRFIRISGGFACDYYIRKFKKYNARKETYPVAFAKGVYGDNVAQVTFTDGIDVSGLTDHRGRPLSELFLTIVKKNIGADAWYDNDIGGERNNIDASEVEYSHCFGKVTMGYGGDVDIKGDSPGALLGSLSHIRYVTETNAIKEGASVKSVSWEDDTFYGDVVEYDKYTDTETVICDIDYRFNTVQREKCNGIDLTYHELTSDAYDPGKKKIQTVTPYTIKLGSKLEGYYYKPHYRIPIRQFGDTQMGSHFEFDVVEATPVVDYGMKISVRTLRSHGLSEGDVVRLYNDEYDYDRYIEFVVTSVVNRARFVMYPRRGEWKYQSPDGKGPSKTEIGVNPLNISRLLSYDIRELMDETLTALYDTPIDPENEEVKYGPESKEAEMLKTYRLNDKSLITVMDKDDCFVNLRNAYNMRLCSINTAIPSYAQRIGRNRYVWRELFANGDERADAIEERVFANGATYITENINFFLRRQDPDGMSGLNNLDVKGNEDVPNIAGSILPESIYKYVEENIEETC